MLGAICGDIIGSVFEHDNYTAKDFILFSRHSKFTDDSVLTTAIADSLIHNTNYASNLRKYYRLYTTAGFSRTFSLWGAADNQEAYNSYGNGSAMRVSPVGWAFNSIEKTLREAEATAIVTHNHPEGIKGAQVIAGAIFIARNGGSKSDIRQFAESFDYDLNFQLNDKRETYHFDATCQGSVPEAIVAFLESSDFEDCIRNAVSIGGDSDTISCIAASIAEAYYNGIPDHIRIPCLEILDQRQLRIYQLFFAKFMDA